MEKLRRRFGLETAVFVVDRGMITEANLEALAPIKAGVEAGTLRCAARIGLAVGEAVNKRKVEKHFRPRPKAPPAASSATP